MKLLALDQALKVSGWAIFENGKLIDNGVFEIKPTLPIEQRLGQIWSELNKVRGEQMFDYVAFEDIQNQANNETYKKLAMVQAAIYLWCYFNDIHCSTLGPSHWRSVLGGNFGRKREEQKQAAIEYVRRVCNKEVSSDEADAICIGLAYLKESKKNQSAF